MSHLYSRVTVNGVRQYEHRVIAEAALKRPLRGSELVHHLDDNKKNNAHSNLVICPDDAYHKLLHARAAAIKAFGDPNARPCMYCKQYEETRHMTFIERGKDSFYYHKLCASKHYEENKDRILANRRARRAIGKRN